jgi:hypothetical protein
MPLEYLHVNFDVESGPGLKDDTIQPVTCTWAPNIVRIATIGDGSCFVHSVLKAIYPRYQILNDANYRIGLVERLRRDLGVILNNEDPRYPGLEYWLTIGSGRFPSMVMQELMDDDMINRADEPELDYSLYGLQRQFNSNDWASEALIQTISTTLGYDIYFMTADTTNLKYYYTVRDPGPQRRSVFIHYIDQTHYETLGVKVGNLIQTVFLPDDPFLQTVMTQFNIQLELHPRDPDQLFIEHAVEIFLNRDTLTFELPNNISEVFAETDPFRKSIDRLYDRIIDGANERIEYFQRDLAPGNMIVDNQRRFANMVNALSELQIPIDDRNRYSEIIKDTIDAHPMDTFDDIIETLHGVVPPDIIEIGHGA